MQYRAETYQTLFLDRDGVINHRPMNDYVKTWDQFEFLPGVLEALHILSSRFNRIIIVTNQQGIGKNLMTREDLDRIHEKMIEEVHQKGGRIDAVYYCPDLTAEPDTCRKPGLRMAEWAKKDFPEIDFIRAIMVGDTEPDMKFGRRAGMKTIFIGKANAPVSLSLIDYQYSDLLSFAKSLVRKRLN